MNEKSRTFFERYAVLILCIFIALTPPLFYSAGFAVRSNTNKVADWLPATFVETGQLRWFREHFVADQFVVVSWEGCRLGGDPNQDGAEPDDPRIEQLARTLVPAEEPAEKPAERAGVWPAENSSEKTAAPNYFKSVTTGRRLLDRLTSPPMNVPYDVAVRRLQGSLIGPDGRQTCVVVTLSDEAIGKFRDAIGRGSDGPLRITHREGEIFKKMRACGIDPDDVYVGGPPIDNVSIDEEGERTMVRLVGLAGLVGLLLAWWSLRSIKLTAIVFSCGLLSAAASLATVWWTGATADAVLLSMPPLVYVLAISGAVHLINYYRDAVLEHGLAGAPEEAIARGWKPALLCSVTTGFGLLSLLSSDLTPIRKFGVYSAVGVMVMLIVLFVYLPAALQFWPIRYAPAPAAPRRETKRSSSGEKPRFDLWQSFGSWIIRHHRMVTTACFLFIVAIGLGALRIHTSVDLMKLFGENARILHDYRRLEEHIGRLVPMEVVLRFDRQSLRRDDDSPGNKSRLSLLERMEIVAEVQQAIETRFGAAGEDVIGPPISAVTFVPPLPPRRQGTSAVMRRAATNSKLENSYSAIVDSGYLRTDMRDGSELWRISVRAAAFKDVDYGRFAGDLCQAVEPVVTKYNDRVRQAISAVPPADLAGRDPSAPVLTTVYTGVIPIVYKAQKALLDSLIQSTFWSFITITPLLMFVARGVRAGLVTMLPNVLPVLVVFGGMGWIGMSVDIGAMMSASIALGVAVDDTIHYLTWFRENLNRTHDRHAAILAAYRHCATPTLQAALINGLGLSVFAFSTFTPTRKFGFLMLTILVAGVVAELIMMPALLAGPLGRCLQPKRRKEKPAESGLPEGWKIDSIPPRSVAMTEGIEETVSPPSPVISSAPSMSPESVL